MVRDSEYNEKAAWDNELDPRQKSFVVRLLNWFHFRPSQLAQSWKREEVLTWELFRAMQVLPRRLFLGRLAARISLRNPSCLSLTDHLRASIGDIEVIAYPLLELKGSLRNRRSDIGLRHPDGTQLWLEAKTVFLTPRGLLDLQQQLQDQQESLHRITGEKTSRVIALVPSKDAIDAFPAISWTDIVDVLRQTRSELENTNNATHDMSGYLFIARELHDRIKTHVNEIAPA
jgi:hypothetical protein